MQVLAHGQQTGQIRADAPLRLLRSMVFGPMEHVLWDATLAKRRIDIEAHRRCPDRGSMVGPATARHAAGGVDAVPS